MTLDELKRLLIATVREEWNEGRMTESESGCRVKTTEEFVQSCLDPNRVNVHLLAMFLRNSCDMPSEQQEAVIAYVRSKMHEAIDAACDNVVSGGI